ncbi:hypothetical protein AJ79_00601 [Helicocarpus griseus UAMH5409]|uniref:Uncharacterized protein n=1 Tax=Helicocarpus griseus UAMH5409 TaxID=1447875 RepID=A0A2B7YBL4_9EURO|nr:hypothetical protein AJ79_00601 [Helicocarpus griseus UAMH5409]
MNCPSRTDECPEHPEWNQNPPLLTGDLTTREDLNGIVNSRAFRNELSLADSRCSDETQNLDCFLDRPPRSKDPAPGWVADAGHHFYRDKEDTCSAARAGSPIGHTTIWPIGIYQQFRQYRTWIWRISLFLLISFLSYYFGSALLSSAIVTLKSKLAHKLPTRSLSRRGTCPNNPSGAEHDYNTPLHVGALIIILAVSSLACAFPLVAVKTPCLRIPASFLFVVRHFGTGVLIATAFVHLLPTAFSSLNDPCLSSFWAEDYPAMPGAIALAAVFLVTVVEMVFSPGRHCCSVRENAYTSSEPQNRGVDALVERSRSRPTWGRHRSRTSTATETSMRRERPLVGNSTSLGRELAHINADLVELERIESSRMADNRSTFKPFVGEQISDDDVSIKLTPEQQHKKAVMQCMLLEMGILFHSVFIGMALAVSTGNGFVVLLIAIAFHQTFEGLALGSRIAVINWDHNTFQPWIMALTYGCTTPLGQAIGLGTHTLYDPNSEVGLIMVGTMNAISSGLLIYASLVELLSEDFLSDESWRILRGKRRVVACILVFLGAFAMSLVGAWA